MLQSILVRYVVVLILKVFSGGVMLTIGSIAYTPD